MWFSRAAVRELGAAGWRPDAAAARTVGFSSRAFARRNATSFYRRAAAQLFRQKRSARNGRRAAAAQKPGFGDAAGFAAREQPEDVAADRIGDLYGCSGITELAGVSRIAEVIENGFAEHFLSSRFSVLCANMAAQRRSSFVRASGCAPEHKDPRLK